MKIKAILSSIMLLILFSCLPPAFEERGRTALEVEKLSLIPYQVGQKIHFIHSNGNAYDFTVKEDNTIWTNNKNSLHVTNVTAYYETFQVRTVKLVSDYPNLEVAISVSSESRFDRELTVNVNSLSTNIPLDKDYKLAVDPNNGNFHESMEFNGKTYYSIVGAKLTDLYADVEPSYSILYNEQGLLQIKLSDDQILSINN